MRCFFVRRAEKKKKKEEQQAARDRRSFIGGEAPRPSSSNTHNKKRNVREDDLDRSCFFQSVKHLAKVVKYLYGIPVAIDLKFAKNHIW